jgi:endonuclease/exonuclease/phosphatase family metal-dependent hydrolase
VRPAARHVTRTLVALVAITAAACFGERPAERLRVLTWNIAAGHGDLTRIASVIRDAGPDVVALQEVDVHWSERSGFVDQAAMLGAALDMHARFGPIYQAPGDEGRPRREFGLAILSRWPIVEFRNHVIPRLSTQSNEAEARPMPGFLEAVVEAGGQRVHVFNTHLDYRPDRSVRAAQVEAMLRILVLVERPVVLLGDFNAPPAAPELSPLFAHLVALWPESAGPGFTYPAERPARRIDYVLASGHLRASDVRLLPGDASDHRPVMAEIRPGPR